MPTPMVRWAQNGPVIDITIDLSDVSNPNIDITETSLHFMGFGCGAHGEDVYNLTLEFFNLVDHEGSTQSITTRNVSFKILKQVKGEEWPRLLKDRQKPAWLKIDFDKWVIQDSDDERPRTIEDEEEGNINKITFEQRMKSDIEKAKHDLVIYGKVAWLSAYYVFQICCFGIVMLDLLRSFHMKGFDAYKGTYDDVAGVFLSAQIFAFVEILHPIIGINKIGLRAPLLNVGIRNFILFVLIAPIKQVQETYSVYVLIIAWTIHELIRFPHNLIMLHNYNQWMLQWFRYTYWIILYPVGFCSAGAVILQSIFIASERNRLTFPLPNILNISFSLSTFLIVFFGCYVAGCIYFLKHMWILRRRKVGGKRRRMKAD